MKFRHFVAGTAIGILPKIIVIALISQGFISGFSGSLMAVFFFLDNLRIRLLAN